MSTLTMNPSAVRTSAQEIFSKKSPFNLYLLFVKSVDIKKSPKQGIPFLQSVDHTIWVSNKLKPTLMADPNAFAQELLNNGSAYELGLTIPSAEYPNESWILYKKGDVPQASTLATIKVEDTAGASVVANVK